MAAQHDDSTELSFQLGVCVGRLARRGYSNRQILAIVRGALRSIEALRELEAVGAPDEGLAS